MTCFLLGMFSLIIFGEYHKLKSVDPTDKISYYSVIFLYCFNVIIAFVSVIIFIYKSKHYLIETRKYSFLNIKMINAGMNINYKHSFYLLIAHTVHFLILTTSAALMGYYLEIVALLYPYIIRMAPVMLCSLNYVSFSNHFKLIKQYSKSIRKFSKAEFNVDCLPNVILDNINEFYAEISIMSKKLIKSYELVIFINLCANTIEIVSSVILIYLRGLNDITLTMCFMYIFGNIIYFQLYFSAYQNDQNVSKDNFFFV